VRPNAYGRDLNLPISRICRNQGASRIADRHFRIVVTVKHVRRQVITGRDGSDVHHGERRITTTFGVLCNCCRCP